MVSPLPFPDWVPWWIHVVVLVALGTFLLLFLLMPFSVLGTKGRLEAIEIRLDELQNELRSLTLRLQEPVRDGFGFEDRLLPVPPAPSRAAPMRTEPRLY